MSNIRFFIADAFVSEKNGSGNPAAVCFVANDFCCEKMLTIAAEFNFSETVFISGNLEQGLSLKFFKPTHEIPICGHATLAASFILFSVFYPNETCLNLTTKFGLIKVSKEQQNIYIKLSAQSLQPLKTTPSSLKKWLNFTPLECFCAPDRYIVLVKDVEIIKNFTFKDQYTSSLDKPIVTICTGTGNDSYAFRYFTPKEARIEDPATGSAQMFLAPLFSKKLSTPHLNSIQYSKRQGHFKTEVTENNVVISGRGRIFCQGTLS